MKVLFDYQIFQMQNHGGISRYFFELMNSAKKMNLFSTSLAISVSSNDYLLNSDFSPSFELNRKYHSRIYRLTEFINRTNSSLAAKLSNYDVLHPTFYETYYTNNIKKPFVITVYDLINELHPTHFQKNELIIEKKKLLMEKATKIIAISENTKKDIIEYYRIPEQKIEITYLAESLSLAESQKVSGIPGKYILFVGNRGGYKNFDLFYDAVKTLLSSDPTLSVVCAGGGSFNQSESDRILKDGVQNQMVQIPFSSNSELKYLYKNAICFVFPSLYEGFGIPVLESFATGCPICLSYSSSLKEIGGEAALYFDPNSVAEIRDSIIKAMALPKSNSLIQKGYEELKKYNWDKTCKDTYNVYKKC